MKFRAITDCGTELWPVETGDQARGIQKTIKNVRFYAYDGTEYTPEGIDALNRAQWLGFLCIALLGLLTAIVGAIEIIT